MHTRSQSCSNIIKQQLGLIKNKQHAIETYTKHWLYKVSATDIRQSQVVHLKGELQIPACFIGAGQ